MDITFTPLEEAHRHTVMEILNYYAEHSFAAYPEMKLDHQYFDMFLMTAKKYPAYVVKCIGGAEMAGYCLLRPYNPLPVFKESAEVSYFLKKEFIGQGLGAKALGRLEEDARVLGIKNLFASVVSHNETSRRFHQKNGFSECGCFKDIGKKFGKSFDIIWYQKVL